METEFVTKKEMNGFVNDLFEGKPVEVSQEFIAPTLDIVDLGDRKVELVSDEEVRDFIVDLFKSKK